MSRGNGDGLNRIAESAILRLASRLAMPVLVALALWGGKTLYDVSLAVPLIAQRLETIQIAVSETKARVDRIEDWIRPPPSQKWSGPR